MVAANPSGWASSVLADELTTIVSPTLRFHCEAKRCGNANASDSSGFGARPCTMDTGSSLASRLVAITTPLAWRSCEL